MPTEHLDFRSGMDDSAFMRGLKRMESSANATASKIGNAFSRISLPGGLGSILGGVGVTGGATGAFAGTLIGIAKAGDQAATAIAKLNIATGNEQEGLRVFEALKELSKQTGGAIEETSSQFARFAIASRQIGATNDEVITLIRLMGQAGAVSGATTEEASAAATQLGQALASGRFQGDELKSIMENMPILAEALAEKLGVSIGELRAMGKEGELTTDKVFPALLDAADDINEKFNKMPMSLSRSFGIAKAQLNELLADWDRRFGIKDKSASIISGTIPAAQRIADSYANRYLTPRAPQFRNIPEGAVTEGVPTPPEMKIPGLNSPLDVGGDQRTEKEKTAHEKLDEGLRKLNEDAAKEWEKLAERKAKAEEKIQKELADAFQDRKDAAREFYVDSLQGEAKLAALEKDREDIQNRIKHAKEEELSALIRTLGAKEVEISQEKQLQRQKDKDRAVGERVDAISRLQENISNQKQREIDLNLMSPDERRQASRDNGRLDRATSRANRKLSADPSRKWVDARHGARDLGADVKDVNLSVKAIQDFKKAIAEIVAAP